MNSESLIKAMAHKNGLQVVKAKLVEECAELIRALARGGDRILKCFWISQGQKKTMKTQ